MEKKDLLKLIEDDDLGLLNVKPKQATTTTDERLLSSFRFSLSYSLNYVNRNLSRWRPVAF